MSLSKKEAIKAILLTGSERIAMSSLPIGEGFKIVEFEAPDGESKATEENVGGIVARLKGANISGTVSNFRVGGMYVIEKGKNLQKAAGEYGVKIGAKTATKSTELKDLNVLPFNKWLRGQDNHEAIDITTIEFKVVGHVAMINRRSSGTTDEEKLLHTHDSYVGHADFEAAVADLDLSNPDQLKLFTNASRELFSSALKDNVIPGEAGRLQFTPVVELKK